MSCPQNQSNSNDTARLSLSRPDLLKLHLAIDRQIVREAQKNQGSFQGLAGAELTQLDDVLTEIMRLEFTDEDINSLADDQMSGFFKDVWNGVKKIGDAIGSAAKKVVQTAGTVLKKAAHAVKWVVTLPLRGAMDLALKAMKGPVAKAFVYAFIPADSPYLKTPEVARKRQIQLDAIQKIRKGLSFTTEHLMKHIRNAIVSHYGKNPEQVIHELANGKDKEYDTIETVSEEGLSGLGEVGAIIAAATGLITAVGGIVIAFRKKNLPSNPDWPQPLPEKENITNDPAYGGTDVVSFLKSPLGIVSMIMAAGGLSYGGYKAFS